MKVQRMDSTCQEQIMIKDTNTFKILRLSISLAKINFKLRNEGSYLGVFWYLLNPLLLFLIIFFVRDQAFSYKNIPEYPIYLLIGILVYGFFINTLSASISVISSNSNFVKSVKIPLESLVIAKVMQSLFSHMFEVILLCVLSILFSVSIGGVFLYIVGIICFSAFILGLSFIFATIGVYVNDLKNIWVAISHALLFLTPIFYFLQEDTMLYQLNQFNPLFYFITFSRSVFLYRTIPETYILAVMILSSVLMLLFGLSIFGRYRARFAELI